MSSLSRELVFLILQFLDEEKFKETVHKLEQESGFFFNMKYFEEKVHAGEWDEVERYLSGFTKVDDNRYSMKIFFEIRKQKYLEALDRHDRAKAVDILVKDLKVFSTFNEELYKEITQLLTLENFSSKLSNNVACRENEQLSKYGDTKSARSIMLVELKKLIEANPLFREKLVFPTLKASRLRTLINQSLNWQHQLCKNPRPNPDIKTLFTDHTCSPPNGARASPVSVPLAAVPKAGAAYPPLTAHTPFQPPPGPSLAGWMANAAASSSVQSAVVAAASIPVPPNQGMQMCPCSTVSMLKRPALTDYQSAESEQLMKRLRPGGHGIDEATYPAPTPQPAWSVDDLPRTVACSLSHGSNVTSMDFHPTRHTLLLVGSANGEFTLYEIGLRETLLSKPFKIRDINACSPQFQNAVVKDSSISINQVTWSPDGEMIGVAFTKHLIHLHGYQPPNETRHLLEIEAHSGGVNDIAFSRPNKQLCVVTCGDDKLIKVWDMHGHKLFTFEGHEAPVYSICPHHKESIQFIFSTSLDGKIKAWLYDNMGSRVDYDAPGKWCTTMLYSADGTRLFSCGTSKEGDSYLVEWNESEGSIKRTYSGFRKRSAGVAGVVQFDTAQNHILAAGEDNHIKFWDVDNNNMLICTDAEGGLPALPRLRFNKEGNLLAVTTADNGFKILANADGLRTLRALGSRPPFEAFRPQYEASSMKVSGAPVVASISPNIGRMDHLDRNSPAKPSPILNGGDTASRSIDIKPRISEEKPDKAKPWELMEVLNPQQCHVATMPETPDQARKVVRLLYTNSGVGLLALGSNAIQRLWKWSRNEQNPSGKATASVVPHHWQPNSGLVMTNDTADTNPEEAVPCIALSKNDSYVMSACGGKVSLFNMMTFKVKTRLKGHQRRITGLAFSTNLGILVSSGADAQLCVWTNDTWEKKRTVSIQMPAGKTPSGDTRVQFSSDQSHLLVVHETQLAIYDASKMERIYQWIPQDTLSASISHASYSCNSQLVFAAFTDGNLGVFDAENLRLRCRIAPSVINSNPPVHPLVVAAHPHEPNQFAVGLSDGSVKVLEPLESEGKWGAPAPADNGIIPNGKTPASSATSNPAADQIQR
ncbi:topless-related1 [Zea mays]|uniref:Topless-related1 n=1 Tax=Zea mays TaxID=4577 RepID=A0A1D6MPP9_MAIZE|nr:topless-related1 [Zea mays]